MYNKVFKSNQVNIGIPVQIKVPLNYQNIKRAKTSNADTNFEIPKNKAEDTQRLIKQARLEAENITKEAELEAKKLIKSAKEEAKTIRNQAEEESRKKGLEKGYKEAKREYEGLIKEAESIKENTLKEYKTALAGIERDAINMILDITKRVIGNEMSQNKDYLLGLVKEAFAECSNKENITMRVSPEDHDFITNNKNKILTAAEGTGEFGIEKDMSLKEGELVLESPYGNVNTGVDTKMNKVKEVFEKVLKDDKHIIQR